MENLKQINKIKEIYANGQNIIQYLKSISGNKKNTTEDILISYDFQAGTYIKSFSKNRDFNYKYCSALATIIDNLGSVGSIIEVGVGEATTLNTVIRCLKHKPNNISGFDISWSRLKFAKGLLNDFNIDNVNLFTANLFEIPLLDNSIDIVYTSHSIEPNGGNEENALKELYRITNKYLILLEPAFEFANSESRERMISNGYVTQLYETARRLNFNIIEHRLFDHCSNPLNPTGLIIIEKNSQTTNEPNLVCPISHTPLIKINEFLLYSKDSFLTFPIIEGIPCLLKENAVLTTHLQTNYNNYKSMHNIAL